MGDFLQRMRERKLVQWMLAYLAAAFALLQGLDIVAQQFGWPESTRRAITVALAVGFFVALVLAWYHGERGTQRVTGTELLILTLLLVIGGGLLWRVAQGAREASTATTGATQTQATANTDQPNDPGQSTAPAMPIREKSIAVLPFENLSDDKSNAYFAAGIQDEILTRLAKIGALSVVSRTSTSRYASSPNNLPQIARQLGVANILEGSVQKSGDTVHINVQLIRAETDKHLWAEVYDRKLENIFGVEGEVAGAIAEALNAKIGGEEQQALATKPTQNADAYDAYLRGRATEAKASGKSPANLQVEADLYARAVKLDANFAQAWSALARADASLYFEQYDASPARREAAKLAVDTAIKLQPDAPDPLLAQAYYQYWVLRDYDTARGMFEHLRAALPNSSEIPFALALISRRQGKWDECLARWQEAIRRDPRDLDY